MEEIQKSQDDQQEEQPQVFNVHIENEKPRFSRRNFIAQAVTLAAGSALTGCELVNSGDSDFKKPTRESEDTTSTKSTSMQETPKRTSTSTRTPTKTSTKTPTPTETLSPTPERILGIINYAHNIWEGPDTNHPHVAKTVVGEEVWVIGRTEDGIWLEVIDSEGNHGWGFAEFIDLEVAIADLPVASNIPTPPPFVGYAATVTKAHTMWMGPDSNHPSIGKTVLNDEVRVLSRTADNIWFEIIDSKGVRGWVFADFIQLDSNVDISNIPLGKNIPTAPAPACGCDGDCGCDGVCGCDGDCGCDGVCSCNSHGCSCDSVHYWYPN